MPLVRVHHSQTRGSSEEELLELGQVLSQSVSANLTCDDLGAQLTPDDIEVFFERKKGYDTCHYDYLIEIESYFYPSRDDNRQQRVNAIREEVMLDLPGKRIAVWLKLLPHAAWSG